MEGFDFCVHLERLYLDRNQISKLEGLQSCTELKELALNSQQISTLFTFEKESIAAIANTLTYLDLSYCNIAKVKDLVELKWVTQLKLNHNQITEQE